MAYFPKKNPNGTLTFLDEKYSIEKVIINPTTQDLSKAQKSEILELEDEIEAFDNIKEEKTFDD